MKLQYLCYTTIQYQTAIINTILCIGNLIYIFTFYFYYAYLLFTISCSLQIKLWLVVIVNN